MRPDAQVYLMPLSSTLLNAAAALLLPALALAWPGARQRLTRGALLLWMLGALLPLLDVPLAWLNSPDQIATLGQNPLFAGVLPGLLPVALGAAGAALWIGPRRAWRGARWVLLGLGSSLLLAWLTPMGTPWLTPWVATRWALPLFPTGHAPLLAGGAALLALRQLWPGRVRLSQALLLALLLGYGATGVAGRLWTRGVALRSLPPEAGQALQVEPANAWLTAWLWVWPRDATLRVGLVGWGPRLRMADAAPAPGGIAVARWNDGDGWLPLLDDAVVNRMVFHVFHAPIARLQASGSQTSLVVQELRDLVQGRAGPTFTLRSNAGGTERDYQVQRFD